MSEGRRRQQWRGAVRGNEGEAEVSGRVKRCRQVSPHGGCTLRAGRVDMAAERPPAFLAAFWPPHAGPRPPLPARRGQMRPARAGPRRASVAAGRVRDARGGRARGARGGSTAGGAAPVVSHGLGVHTAADDRSLVQALEVAPRHHVASAVMLGPAADHHLRGQPIAHLLQAILVLKVLGQVVARRLDRSQLRLDEQRVFAGGAVRAAQRRRRQVAPVVRVARLRRFRRHPCTEPALARNRTSGDWFRRLAW